MKKIDSEIVNISGCILEEIDSIVSLVKSRYSQLASIIIGIASNVKDGKLTSKIEYSELQGIDIIKYFSDKYSIPVDIENDMNIAIKGYWERHNNKNIESVVNIYMGDNGIGSSMILGGHVWKGSSNFAGELHYLPICDNNIKYCTSGFEGVNMVEYYGKIVQSYIALINPSLVVIYNNSYISDKLEEIKNYCKNIIPEEVMPNIIISNEFIKDYEYGLSKMAIDLLNY
nr:ROK family protein [Paeniclostridium sordellii]